MLGWTVGRGIILGVLHLHPPLYAKRVSEALVHKTLGLDELPRKGHMVAELNEETVRELGLYSYRILYEIKPNNLIEVLAVIHKRRNLEPGEIPR